MQLRKQALSGKTMAVAAPLVVVFISILSWAVVAVRHHDQTNNEKRYFTQLPSEAKAYYLPQLAIFKSPAPAGLWQTQCYQDVGYADNAAPIICGVVANQLFGTTLSLQEAQAKFRQLAMLANRQGFTSVRTASDYKPIADVGTYNTPAKVTIPLHFTATAPDGHCSVSVDYGSSNMLAPSPSLSIPADITDQSTMAIYYDFACSKQITGHMTNVKQNDYMFPGTAGGYPLTQDHYGNANPFIVAR